MVKLRKYILTVTMVTVIILIAVLWLFPSDDDFHTDNPFWNGTKDVSLSCPVSPIASLSDLPTSPRGATLILIPYLDFIPDELEALNEFVSKGGTLVLADDYGYGNQALEYLGLKASFSGQPLLDPLANYKNERFPQIFNLTSSPITLNAEGLVLNHATCLTDVEADNILALSSSFSFIDLDGNQVWNGDEPTGPLPVISRHNLGSGQVILIADPSLFINSMQAIESNDHFIQNIAATTTTELLIDQSHLTQSNLHQTKDLLAYLRGALVTPVGSLTLVIAALTITLMPLWHERREH